MRQNRFTLLMMVLLVGSLLLTGALPAGAQAPAWPEEIEFRISSPLDPNLEFGVAAKQVLRSQDGGQTWELASALPSAVTVLRPANHEETLLYAGTESSGVFRSFDGGESWQAISMGLGLLPGTILEITALDLDPKDDGLLYAATGYWLGSTEMHFSPADVAVSMDFGSTWLSLGQPPISGSRVTALSPLSDQPLAVVATTVDGTDQPFSPDTTRLVSLLEDSEAAVAQQIAAAQALGRLGDPSATPALIAALQSSDLRLVAQAAKSLGTLQAAEAVPTLRALLMAEEPTVPSALAEALAAIATPEAMVALMDALGEEATASSRHAAMGSLEAMGSLAVPSLMAAASSRDPSTQRDAVELLGWIGDPAAQGRLLTALESEHEEVRAQAAWALGELGDPAASRALAAVVSEDPSSDVRLQAQHALAHLAGPEAPLTTDAIQPSLPEPEPAVVVEPVSEGQRTAMPTWLDSLLPMLRWIVLGIALILAAFLPWYQTTREERRHRHN
jgi:HEAT repeat protein